MPPRKLLWTRGAVQQLREYLTRRKDKAAVRTCIEQHMLAVANAVESTAQKWDGPFEKLWRYGDFKCRDGAVVLYIHAEFDVTEDTVTVLGCGTIPL
jgi:hypothetical protein